MKTPEGTHAVAACVMHLNVVFSSAPSAQPPGPPRTSSRSLSPDLRQLADSRRSSKSSSSFLSSFGGPKAERRGLVFYLVFSCLNWGCLSIEMDVDYELVREPEMDTNGTIMGQ